MKAKNKLMKAIEILLRQHARPIYQSKSKVTIEKWAIVAINVGNLRLAVGQSGTPEVKSRLPDSPKAKETRRSESLRLFLSIILA